MTPNNILNMAMLKGLDIISITDHNSTLQLKVIEQIAEAYDFLVIPGVEVTVKEGFDVLCYFKTFENANKLNSILETYLTDDFGGWTKDNQVITDIYDMTFDCYPKSLTHTELPYTELYTHVKNLDGIVVLAHIERNKKSALNVYQLSDIQFDGIEIQKYKKQEFIENHQECLNYPILTSSDAHSLLEISEKEETISLEEKSIDAFFNFFKGDQT